MDTQEFYIRNAGDTEARGPFTLEQLMTLTENGQILRETLYYDPAVEQWVAVGDNADLVAELFPEKKVLKVKAKENFKSINATTGPDKAITVQEMLAAADGRTEDTKEFQARIQAQHRAASIGRYATLVTIFCLAAAFVLPSIDVIMKFDIGAMLAQPLCFIGVIDLLLGVLLLLGVTEIYPFVRFIAMLTVGFAGLFFAAQQQSTLVLASIASSVGVVLATISLNLIVVIVASLASVGGAAVLLLHFLG